MPQAKSNIRLLIIDDELGFYQSFRAQHQAIYAFEITKDIDRGMDLIVSFKPDAILLDLKFNWINSYDQGVKVILPLVVKKIQFNCPIIVVTSAKEKHIHQKALENGAWACLQKIDYDGTIWHNKILETIAAFRGHLNTNHFTSKKTTNNTSTSQDGFFALSPVMQALKRRLKTLGEKYTDISVLLLGETGVGKEVAARYLHSLKANAKNLPFETVNLGAYPEELLFSEVFGHKKGSFAGATEDKIGVFEKAKKGTLFLDEIGDVNLRTQVGFLNILNDRTFRRVGSSQEIIMDAQLIFSTNRDLEKAIKAGSFREDFYFRISDYTIEIPPLRERKEEILPLITYYLNQLCKTNNHPLYRKEAHEVFSPSAMETLQQYYWPGNIRELRNTIQNLIIEVDVWGKKQIDESMLPQRFSQKRLLSIPTIQEVPYPPIAEFGNRTLPQHQAPDLNWPIAKQTAFAELSIIEKVLRESGGRKDAAAKAVGLKNDQHLRYKVSKYSIEYGDVFDNFPIICKLYKLKL